MQITSGKFYIYHRSGGGRRRYLDDANPNIAAPRALIKRKFSRCMMLVNYCRSIFWRLSDFNKSHVGR
jgi:hypothetical protein